jgi:hypothetical protein
LTLRRLALLICLLVSAVYPGQLNAQPQQKSAAGAAHEAAKPAQIDRNGVLILIRSALIALDQGNKMGNYTVLRDLGAPGFQTNTAARLAEIFAARRRDNIDLSGVAVLDPQLTVLPEIEANGMLRMAGFFPSVPTQVNFDLIFAPVSGQWRLFGISVNLGSATPAAPNPSPPAAPNPSAPAAQIKPAPAKKPALPAATKQSVTPAAPKEAPGDGAKQ